MLHLLTILKVGPAAAEGTHTDISEEALRGFAERFRGEVIRPDEGEYDRARRVWNEMINKYPAIIARCTGVADVIAAVDFARENGLLVAIRGGGHNVAGNAVCDGGIVIDLSGMNDVHVDPERRTVRAGGGATLGEVDRETQVFGLATPLGVVTETGIAGLTLNGGVGHLRRKYGLAYDNLESVEVVTAGGEVLTTSRERNEDLFWAVRGGGGNFGVVTFFGYRLHEVGPEVCGLFVVYPGDDATETFRRFREYADSAPEDASVLPFYLFVPEVKEYPEESWGEPAVGFLGCYAGDADEGSEEFHPLREVVNPIVDFSGRMPYTELQSLLNADYPDGRRYYWKTTYIEELTDDLIEFIVRRGKESPSTLSTVDLWHLGGAIGEPERDATAFWHRDKPYMLTFEANWDDPEANEANIAWVREGLAELREMAVASGGYGNFPGFQEDSARTVFGENYDRLVAVKSEYDPENLFRLNQNIAPRTDGH